MKNEIDNGGKADVSGEPVARSSHWIFIRPRHEFSYIRRSVDRRKRCLSRWQRLPSAIYFARFRATKQTVHLLRKAFQGYIRPRIYRCCLVFWRYGRTMLGPYSFKIVCYIVSRKFRFRNCLEIVLSSTANISANFVNIFLSKYWKLEFMGM